MEWDKGAPSRGLDDLSKGDTFIHQGALLMKVDPDVSVVLAGDCSGGWRVGDLVKGDKEMPVTEVNAWKVVRK